MTMINPATHFTADDLLRLEGGDSLYELVDGELIEKKISRLSGETTVIISAELFRHIRSNGLGKLYSEATFKCFPKKPNQIRRPDLAFIATAKLAGVPDEGHIPIRPDLAIEIVSVGDDVYNLDQKIADYRSAGIPLTWIFNPAQRMVRIYEGGRLKGRWKITKSCTGIRYCRASSSVWGICSQTELPAMFK